mmetsp:Transcript_27421/g.70482  ORF Transcript_27421/g.70482 Transcript_27421/m.70482 type:complete len:520 (+) Transcript_27421:2-1561(+)
MAGGRAGGRALAQTCSALITTSVTAPDVESMKAEIKEAEAGGADVVELRLDFLGSLDPERDIRALLDACSVPAIVTLRPTWEGGNYGGDEEARLSALRTAAAAGAAYVDVELLAADKFLADGYSMPEGVKLILSNHDFEATPAVEVLRGKIDAMWEAGADIAKLATTATDISDAINVLSLLEYSKGPTIALAMGERGVITRLLAPKYGGYLTFAALEGRPSAPGQPTLADMRRLYRAPVQDSATKVFGIVGNPVSHSRSPVLHNRAMEAIGFNGVYVPLLVDDMASFLKAFSAQDFAGFSVTIPHKEAALENADFVDPVASSIGAVNTLVRQPDGSLSAYNTDWEAAINAIEDGLGGAGSLQGKVVVVLGAGGAGKALAFGAAQRGATVKVANRNVERARELVKSIPGAEAVSLAEVASGAVSGDVLANTTAVGMHPLEDDTPVPQEALSKYMLAFDAIYTPMETRLLAEAKAAGCGAVSGLEMFVGQAVKQFEHFTKTQATPEVVDLMRSVVVDSLSK